MSDWNSGFIATALGKNLITNVQQIAASQPAANPTPWLKPAGAITGAASGLVTKATTPSNGNVGQAASSFLKAAGAANAGQSAAIGASLTSAFANASQQVLAAGQKFSGGQVYSTPVGYYNPGNPVLGSGGAGGSLGGMPTPIGGAAGELGVTDSGHAMSSTTALLMLGAAFALVYFLKHRNK